MDRGAWWAAVHGVAESDMPELLSVLTCVNRPRVGVTGKTLWALDVEITDILPPHLARFRQSEPKAE